MGFLPDGYKAPSGDYMRFEKGENTFRVLGSAITGWEYWNAENKPVRLREQPVGTPRDIRVEEDGKATVKHFWAFPVWNYEAGKIQVLEVTQKGIMESMRALVQNPKWGDPKGYDVTVTKEGDGLNTTYQVIPNPHTALDVNVADRWNAMVLNLDALYDGGDPFVPAAQAGLTPEQAAEII